MGMRVRELSLAAMVVVVSAVCWAGSLAMAAGPRSGYALRPGRSIGPISIGERKSRVEQAVGRRTSACPTRRGSVCVRRYDSPRGNLGVQYVGSHVTAIGSSSGQITLGGIPIRRGPRHLRRQLRGWSRFPCQGWQIYEHGGQPSTSIYFGYGQVQMDVSAQAEGGCADSRTWPGAPETISAPLPLIDHAGSAVGCWPQRSDTRSYWLGWSPSRAKAVRISSGSRTTATPLPRPSAISPVETR